MLLSPNLPFLTFLGAIFYVTQKGHTRGGVKNHHFSVFQTDSGLKIFEEKNS